MEAVICFELVGPFCFEISGVALFLKSEGLKVSQKINKVVPGRAWTKRRVLQFEHGGLNMSLIIPKIVKVMKIGVLRSEDESHPLIRNR